MPDNTTLAIFIEELKGFDQRMVNFSADCLHIIGEEYKLDFAMNIALEQSPDGSAMLPLKPMSKYPRKPQRDPANHILMDTDKLVQSFRFSRTGNKVTIYSEVDYADKQQSGDPSTNLPPRPFVGISARANRRIRDRLTPLQVDDWSAAFIDRVLDALDFATEDEDGT